MFTRCADYTTRAAQRLHSYVAHNHSTLYGHDQYNNHHLHVPEGLGVFLFLDPQDEVGPSISSSVVLCSFVFWFIL